MNNNHFNTNNWVGTTHLDFFKNSSNALSNYTSNTSNILENDILIYSNINYLYTSNSSNSNIFYTSNTSNIILNRYDKLIKEEEVEITTPLPVTLKHTYIYNKNDAGEIRFQNNSYITDISGFPTGTPNYKVKVDIDGKLKLYWVYNPLVSVTYLGGWHEPIGELAGLIADSINQGGLISGLEGQIVINKNYTDAEITLIWAYIEGVQNGLITTGGTDITPSENARDMLQWGSPEIEATEITPLIPASPVQNANALSTFNQRYQQLTTARNTIRDSTIARASSRLIQYIAQNPLTSFVLGTGFTAAGIAYSVLQGIEYNRYYTGVIENVIENNSNLSSSVRLSLHEQNQSNFIASNLIEYCSNTYFFGISQGFVNSNVVAQQYLNAINTNEIKISQTNISNIFVASNVLSNINLNQGFLNSNTTNQQYLSNLKCDNLFLNNGNITGVNNITTNTLNISGKIQQFGNYLDETYLRPEDLYNLTYTYTTERRYPPKAFNTSTAEKSVNFLNTLVYNQTLVLDNIGIAYGDGQYEIYSSSTYDNGITTKDKLFNFDNSETTNTSRWGINQFNSGTGDYQGNSSIDGVHYGDWIIIKLPLPFLLTRFRIYKNTSFPQKAPSLWKCFGSSDGIEWFEIFQAHNFTRLTEANYNLGYYEKTLANTFTTLYNYIGFSFNSLTGTAGATDLNFAELQLFGKEQLSYNIDSYKYTSSNAVKYLVRNEMPDVGKRQAFYVSIPALSTYYDGTSATTYYKYDLDLRLYTKTQTIANTSDLMRIFKIRFWYVPSYFGSYINGEPYVSSYEVYMSYKANAIPGMPQTAGLNIYSVGFPDNTKLANILPNQLMLLRNVNGSINYLTIVSRTAPCDIYVILEDMLY
jgi:hypothetical protein